MVAPDAAADTAREKTERVMLLARLAGISVDPAEAVEVADRLDCLLAEMDKVSGLDLSGIEPVAVFPEEAGHGE